MTPIGTLTTKVPTGGMRQRIKYVEVPKLAELIEEQRSVSEERVPLTAAVRDAFACPDCMADVVIPRVIRLHDEGCVQMRGVT